MLGRFGYIVAAERVINTWAEPTKLPRPPGRHKAVVSAIRFSAASPRLPTAPVGYRPQARSSNRDSMPDWGQIHVKNDRISSEWTQEFYNAAHGPGFGDRPPGHRILYQKIRLHVNGQPIWRSRLVATSGVPSSAHPTQNRHPDLSSSLGARDAVLARSASATSSCSAPRKGPGAARCPRGTCCDGRANQAALAGHGRGVEGELERRRVSARAPPPPATAAGSAGGPGRGR